MSAPETRRASAHEGGLLRDLTVLELPSGTAGAVCGMLLADNGARVIKFEKSLDTVQRGATAPRVWDRGKESVEFGPHGVQAEQVDALAATADVLIHGCSTAVARELGLDLESIASANPRLVVCSVTPYGRSGPLAGRIGNDALISARTGMVAEQPGWYPGPTYLMHPFPSVSAGLLMVQGVLAALIARRSSGFGQSVDVSLLAGAVALTAHASGAALRKQHLRWVGGPIGLTPFAACYECADGKWLTIACIHSGFAKKTVEALGILQSANEILKDVGYETPDLLASPESCVPLFTLISQVMRTRSREEWIHRLEECDVPVGAANTPEEAIDALRDLGATVDVIDPEVGVTTQPASALRFGRSARRLSGPHTVGQDTVRIPRGLVRPTRRSAPKSPVAPGDPGLIGPSVAPLHGVRVVEIANVIAGPLTSRFLADFGADVVKIEAPGGGDIARKNRSPEFLALNAGKRSIVIDLKTPEGREIGRRLALSADVVVNNMRFGVAERLGLGADDLRAANPRLVYCEITGYGSEGTLASRPGFDSVAGSMAGLAMAQGGVTGKPAKLRAAVVDHSTSLLAAAGVLMALFARDETGEGVIVETSLLATAMLIGAERLVRYRGSPPYRAFSQYGPNALNRLYQTADGWIQLAALPGEFGALCGLVNSPVLGSDKRFADPASREANDDALAAELSRCFAMKTAREWYDILDRKGIPCAQVEEDYERGFFTDPQAIASGLIADVADRVAGRVQVAHRWVSLSASDVSCRTSAPPLGDHGMEILEGLGYSQHEISRLRDAEVVWFERKPEHRHISFNGFSEASSG